MAFLNRELSDDLLPFSGKLSERFYEVRQNVADFCEDIKKIEAEENGGANGGKPGTYYVTHEKSARLKDIARERGLWNFFLPEVSGITVMEYSPIAEMLGATNGSHYMNCSAPDTGNMEVLAKFGNAEQKKQWLEPLLNQEIRSAFAMTEPGVASSDAQNISSSIVRDGDEYVLNGHKWYISGAMRKTCKVFVFLGKTPNPAMKSHEQQSMILCPCWNAEGTETYPGVTLLRGMGVFGHPGDHAEIIFDNVRVPAGNMILGEGRGFEIAQGRLGPGRIHHCMRSIGSAEMALSAIIFRIRNRFAFGSKLEEKDSIRQIIAEARIQLTMCRSLCYLAAVIADERGFKDAKKYIAMIKVDAPRMALKIIDDAMQVHGAHGVSQDSELSGMYSHMRTLRVADGPDIVHMNTIVKEELKAPLNPMAAKVSGVNPNIHKYKKAVLPHGYFDDYFAMEEANQDAAKL